MRIIGVKEKKIVWIWMKEKLLRQNWLNHNFNSRERERDLNGRGRLGNKWGFLKDGGSVIKKKMSAQSSFCSSDTTNACPKPSTSPAFCHNFFFSSIPRSNNFFIPVFTSSTSDELTPWFFNCNRDNML